MGLRLKIAFMAATISATAAISGFVTPAYAKEFTVNSHAQFDAAATAVQAGDTIILARGVWRDFQMKISGIGTADKPIIVRPESPGAVILSGQSNLQIGGSYLVVSGLVFRDGYSPTNDVISFRIGTDDVAQNARVTEVVIDHFNNPDRFATDYWVSLHGRNNRFDHGYLVGKSNQGVTMAVRLDAAPGSGQPNNHRIDHNYFGPRPALGSNGGETLRIGTSQYAETLSKTRVENNYFENVEGEVEIISVKSGGNIIRGNIFSASRGAVTLRHGDGNLVENNVFFGKGRAHSGGIRVINRNQIVRNNYMEGLRGTGFASALAIMNGVPNSPANRYVQVTNALVEHNSIVDSSRLGLGIGSDSERSAAPADSHFSSNLLSAADDAQTTFFDIRDDISGIAFSDNVMATCQLANAVLSPNSDASVCPQGIVSQDLALLRASNGLLYPQDTALAGIGVSPDLNPVKRADTGPKWYPKPASEPAALFNTGQVIMVPPGDDTLTKALATAQTGDRLELAAGDYFVSQTLRVQYPVTIIGAAGITAGNGPKTQIRFDRATLFELEDGGSLALSGLNISGQAAQDNVGNAIIRTTTQPILRNFQISLDHVTVTDLTVNGFFDVIALGKSTFADQITITNSVFADISGSVVKANSESDEYGRYNVEYLTVSNSIFRNIDQPILAVHRRGRDESTFGPHVMFHDNDISAVGRGAKNLAAASLDLWGVQELAITDNAFIDSAPASMKWQVGAPFIMIANNDFDNTPAPLLTGQNAGDYRDDIRTQNTIHTGTDAR